MHESAFARFFPYCKHLSAVCGVPVYLLDTSSGAFLPAGCDVAFCHNCCVKKCSALSTHLYGASEAARWNGQYIYYCPLGLVFLASSISLEDGQGTGAMILGPLLMGARADALSDLSDRNMATQAETLKAFSTEDVTHLSQVLHALTHYAAGLPRAGAQSFVYEPSRQVQPFCPRDKSAASTDLLDYEKKLRLFILSHDKRGAQALLNQLLGHIYCANQFALEDIKARLVELVVVLSRASIDAGADIQEILFFNTNYIHEIEQFSSLDALSVYLSGIMHRYVSYCFDFAPARHSDAVYKAMSYVRKHLSQKISLEDIAGHVHLSRSYLSSLFKEETGQSLTDFIKGVRVEKSRQYLANPSLSLAQIALLCGFEDQSYFTKVFKSQTGLSPNKYRQAHPQEDFPPSSDP